MVLLAVVVVVDQVLCSVQVSRSPSRVRTSKRARFYMIGMEVLYSSPPKSPLAVLQLTGPSDGREDIVVATVDGEIVFIHQNGTPIYGETLKVPQLRVKKDWFVGLDAKNIAASLALHEQPPDTPPPIPDGQDGPESLPPKRKLLSIELDQVQDPVLMAVVHL